MIYSIRVSTKYLTSIAVYCEPDEKGVYHEVKNKKTSSKNEQHTSFRYGDYGSYKNKS